MRTTTFAASQAISSRLRPLAASAVVAFACIGPVTADTASARGLNVEIVPKQYTVGALVAAIEDHYADKTG